MSSFKFTHSNVVFGKPKQKTDILIRTRKICIALRKLRTGLIKEKKFKHKKNYVLQTCLPFFFEILLLLCTLVYPIYYWMEP